MRHVLCAVLLCSLASTASADVDPAILDAVKKVKPSDYPSANAVTIINSQSVVYQPDGQFTNTMHVARLVLTNEGKKEASTTSLYYTKDAEKMEVISAQVIKKDGTVVPLKDFQDTEQSGEMNIYDPQGRALKVTVSNLAVGDAVDITYKLTRMLPTRVGHFNDIFGFQSTEPLLNASYTVDGPAKLPLTTHVYHPERTTKIETTKTKAGDRVLYKWSVKNVAQLVPEPGMNWTSELPLLVVTTDPSWHNFAKWWAQLVEPKMQMTPELKDKVKELTKDAKTDDEKIRKIYDFVAQDIRYRGLGVGPRTGYTPRTAHETMTSRWGVCRDVSILMTAMLRETGIDAYPVITNVGDPVLPKIAYDGFNHAIVAVKDKKSGGWVYMDPTAKNNNALLPGNEAEQNTLIASLQGSPLLKIPAADPGVNLGHAIANTTIHADGSMTSKVKLETKGMFDLVVRSVAAMMSEDQQKEIVESLLHHSLPDAQLVSFSMTSALALFTPMEVNIEIKVPNAAPKTGDYRLLRTVVTSGALGLVENALPQLLGATPSRKYGLDAQVTFQYDQTETITLPADTKIVALPNPAKAASNVSQLSASCAKKDATTITCARSFSLKSRFIDPTQYKSLRTSVASLAQVARQPVILAAAGGK